MTTFAMSVDASLLEDVLADLGLTPEQLERTREAFASRGIEVEVAEKGAVPRLHFAKGISRIAREEGLGSGVYVCNVGLEYGFRKDADGNDLSHDDPYNRVAWCGRSYVIRGRLAADREAKYIERMQEHRSMFESSVTKRTGMRRYPNLCLDNILPEERRDVKRGAHSADVCR